MIDLHEGILELFADAQGSIAYDAEADYEIYRRSKERNRLRLWYAEHKHDPAVRDRQREANRRYRDRHPDDAVRRKKRSDLTNQKQKADREADNSQHRRRVARNQAYYQAMRNDPIRWAEYLERARRRRREARLQAKRKNT